VTTPKFLLAVALVASTAGAGVAHSQSMAAIEYEELSYDQDPIGYPDTPVVGRVRYFCDGSSDVWGRPGEYGKTNYYGC
jgi:hypothetical protein